jgi:hypothetical protein
MDARYVTGRCVADDENSDIYYTTISEALIWDKEEEIVQLVQVETFTTKAYQVSEMRISGNRPHLRLTTADREEALQMYLSIAFGM